MGHKKDTVKKNAKGTVAIINAKQRIRLRWRYQGERYTMNLYAFNQVNLGEAKKVALQIELDMVKENFDTTLDKYRPVVFRKAVDLPVQKTLVQLFHQWVMDYRHKSVKTDVDYYAMDMMLNRWGKFTPEKAVKLLNQEKIGPRTYNRRLFMLQAFFKWTTKNGHTTSNPLEDVQRKKVTKTERPDRKPFTEKEIHQILEAFRTDKFTPKSSTVNHSHYYPFMYFMFQTGVRPAEAIGLRVKHVDQVKCVVEIKETLARSINCSNANKRIRKETKNGKERKLPMDADLFKVLKPQLKGKKPDDLVFQSPNGLPIDDKMLQRRVFRTVLKMLKIEYRVLYSIRHTFGSRCIHQGITPVMTAFLMGNNPITALNTYTHLLGLPKSLPSLPNY